jgi:hypothetical protein
MTKLEFRNIAKLCPWYYHDGQPKCSGNKTVNCAKNRCAMLFWLSKWPTNNTVEDRQAKCVCTPNSKQVKCPVHGFTGGFVSPPAT